MSEYEECCCCPCCLGEQDYCSECGECISCDCECDIDHTAEA